MCLEDSNEFGKPQIVEVQEIRASDVQSNQKIISYQVTAEEEHLAK